MYSYSSSSTNTSIKINTLEQELRNCYHFKTILGHHPKIVEILKLISQVADTDATVLIQGEHGTGKELVAQALHCNSSRKDKPFVPINCGALAENLLESELFGHVKGSFTGAFRDKEGWFERANGGTIFLDEVSEMPPALQVKLLRILQTGDYSRVGSTETSRCHVRIVAASNKELHKLVKEGKFREDVYYRLNIIDLDLPPLRERKSDILLLVLHFLEFFGTKYNKMNLCLSAETNALLQAYNFPGNVRELENIIQRAVILSEGDTILPQHLPASVYRQRSDAARNGKPSSFKLAKQSVMEKFEQEYISECLQAAKGNISHAAKKSEISFRSFYAKMKKYGINPNIFKIPAG